MNLAIWDAIDRGEIEIDEENDKVKILKDVEPSSDADLRHKILRVIQHYSREETNVTRGRINGYVKDPVSGQGYAWHEYIMAVQHLIDGGLVEQEAISVPEATKKFVDKKGRKKEKVTRPAHTFAFLGLVENSAVNTEWNQKTVDKWKEDMDEAIAKK
jgi:hypothetical protein